MTGRQPSERGDACLFLDKLDPDNRFTFQTFDDSDHKNTRLTRVFHGSLEQNWSVLERFNKQGAGIFVTVNQTDLKGRKTQNIIGVRAVFIDLDGAPLTPVRKFELRPHIVVESSLNRWHAYWLCMQLPLDDFTIIQKNIAKLFEGDPVISDAPRVMRIPGFHHNKGKPFRVRIEQLVDSEPYHADEIRRCFGNTDIQSKSTKQIKGRNIFLFSKACSMRKSGLSEVEVRRTIDAINQKADPKSCPNFSQGPLPESEVAAICKSIMNDRYSPERDNLEGEKDIVAELNRKHSVVMVGGKCVIANEQINPTFGFSDITFSSQADLIARYANRPVGRGQKRTTAGKVWLAHPNRRQYEGIVFAPGEEVPGYLNLDKGFAVQPQKGDCSRFLEHVQNNICKGDEEIGNYLIAWMADAVQNRARRTGIAVVLRGREGTGKGVFCNQFGSLFGPHFTQVTQAGHLTGNFNSHLKDKLIVYADEAFWAGDKKAEGVLKALITEETIQIEMKGKDVITFRNYIRLLISSNQEWVIPAGNEARRFFVIDVGEARVQDRAYFDSVVDQMNNGGKEALLHYLLEYDLSGIALGSPPQTQALQDQKTYSASPVQNWWLERLIDGHTMSEGNNWVTEVHTERLYEDYYECSEKIGIKRRASSMGFGKELRKLIPEFERVRIQKDKQRHWVYRISDLEECRRHFDLITRGEHDWPVDD